MTARWRISRIRRESGIGQMNVDVRTAGNPETFLPAVREAMRGIAPELPMLESDHAESAI